MTEARAILPQLLHRAEGGEELTITRHGRPVAVLVSHDRWMKIARLDVFDDVRQIRALMAEARSRPVTEESFSVVPGYDADAHIAWNRELEAGGEVAWERVERERGES